MMSFKETIKHYYEAWGDVQMVNAVLKIALLIISFLLCISLFIIMMVTNRPPLLISVLPSGHAVVTKSIHDSESSAPVEVTHFIKQFMGTKYNWTPKNVESQFKSANTFLSSNLIRQTQKKTEENIAYIKNTGLRQVLYLKTITAQQSEFQGKGTFTVIGDRVLGIKSSKFTTPFKVILTVEKTKRSQERPHGLHITRLEEVLNQKRTN